MAVGQGEARWPRADEIEWLDPEDLVREGYRRSRVVMLNEAHSGLRRCVRTRRIGLRALPVARQAGARLMAVEMLGPPGAPRTGGMLDQPDLAQLLQAAQDLGLRLAGYDVDDATIPIRLRTKVKSPAFTNWRDGKQAGNLADLLAELAEDESMLVWCGNLHHAKVRFMAYRPTGWQFAARTGVDPFVIDQTVTVDFAGTGRRSGRSLVLDWAHRTLMRRGGEAGFIWEPGLPRLSPGCDAWLLSLDNGLE
jgi:hypothetical protein